MSFSFVFVCLRSYLLFKMMIIIIKGGVVGVGWKKERGGGEKKKKIVFKIGDLFINFSKSYKE